MELLLLSHLSKCRAKMYSILLKIRHLDRKELQIRQVDLVKIHHLPQSKRINSKLRNLVKKSLWWHNHCLAIRFSKTRLHLIELMAYLKWVWKKPLMLQYNNWIRGHSWELMIVIISNSIRWTIIQELDHLWLITCEQHLQFHRLRVWVAEFKLRVLLLKLRTLVEVNKVQEDRFRIKQIKLKSVRIQLKILVKIQAQIQVHNHSKMRRMLVEIKPKIKLKIQFSHLWIRIPLRISFSRISRISRTSSNNSSKIKLIRFNKCQIRTKTNSLNNNQLFNNSSRHQVSTLTSNNSCPSKCSYQVRLLLRSTIFQQHARCLT